MLIKSEKPYSGDLIKILDYAVLYCGIDVEHSNHIYTCIVLHNRAGL